MSRKLVLQIMISLREHGVCGPLYFTLKLVEILQLIGLLGMLLIMLCRS